jgi:AcrR family transcriptional regulator
MHGMPAHLPNQLIREQIRDAAANRFKTYGYTKTTMAEIAEDTGMSAANLYRYFANKQDIAADCTRKYISDRSALLEQSVNKPGLDAAGKLRAYFITTLHYSYRMAHEHNKIHQLVETITGERLDIVHLKIESEKAIITEILKSGIESGEFVIDDLESAATSIHASHILFDVPVFMGIYTLEKFEEVAQSLVELLLKGLAGK